MKLFLIITNHFSAVSLAFILLLSSGYLYGYFHQQKKKKQWSTWYLSSFLLGVAILTYAVLPSTAAWAHHDFRGHMVQHLLIGMLAPLALVLSAPMTLILRTVSAKSSRRITRFLNSRFSQFISHPFTAFMLNIGGMYLLYMTPLYMLSVENPAIHYLVHLHFLAAGYLFTWSILAGPDISPHSPGMWLRLSVLLISIATHSILGKIMYGYEWSIHQLHGTAEIQEAAKIMYYGGDVTELLLVIALFGMWYKAKDSSRYSLKPLI